MSRVLLCGADGQLGRELQFTCPDSVDLVPCARAELDIGDGAAIAGVLDSSGATAIINAAAYTAVDGAESDVTTAHRVNAVGPDLLARQCAARGLRLLHVSTDFVFDGRKGSPYCPDDPTRPLGVYGQTKLEGEQAVLGSGADALILRSGWIYSRHRSNFVKTMLRLMAERAELGVVEDQIGTPTWARSLAEVCWALLLEPRALGVYHWSDAGACSWYDFAVAIGELATAQGILASAATIAPIPSRDYPTPAARPTYSVLDKSATRALLGHSGGHWRQQLAAMLMDLGRNGALD